MHYGANIFNQNDNSYYCGSLPTSPQFADRLLFAMKQDGPIFLRDPAYTTIIS